MLCYQNGYLLIFIWACHLHCIWDMVVVRGCTISRVVSRAAMDIIFRGTYHAPRRLLLSRVVSCAATDAWTTYVPHGSRTERQRVCILKKDMHHYIWHCISWHYTFIINELEYVFWWSCECFSVKLVTVEYGVVIENVYTDRVWLLSCVFDKL